MAFLNLGFALSFDAVVLERLAAGTMKRGGTTKRPIFSGGCGFSCVGRWDKESSAHLGAIVHVGSDQNLGCNAHGGGYIYRLKLPPVSSAVGIGGLRLGLIGLFLGLLLGLLLGLVQHGRIHIHRRRRR